MSARIQVVKGVENEIKRREPVHVELAILDVRMVCFELGLRSEFAGDFFRDLSVT